MRAHGDSSGGRLVVSGEVNIFFLHHQVKAGYSLVLKAVVAVMLDFHPLALHGGVDGGVEEQQILRFEYASLVCRVVLCFSADYFNGVEFPYSEFEARNLFLVHGISACRCGEFASVIDGMLLWSELGKRSLKSGEANETKPLVRGVQVSVSRRGFIIARTSQYSRVRTHRTRLERGKGRYRTQTRLHRQYAMKHLQLHTARDLYPHWGAEAER